MDPIVYILKAPKSKYLFTTNIDAFGKPELLSFFKQLKRIIVKASHRVAPESDKNMARLFDLALTIGPDSLKKAELVSLIVSFYSDLSNMTGLMRRVAPKFVELWEELLDTPEINMEEAEKTVGEQFRPLSTPAYWRTIYLVHPLLMGVEISSPGRYYFSSSRLDKSQLEIWIPAKIRGQMTDAFSPESTRIKLTPEVPENWRIENYEQAVNLEIMQLHAWSTTHDLIGASENVSWTKVKSNARKIKLEEFPDFEVRTPLSRRQMIVLVYISMLLHNANQGYSRFCDSESVTDFARYVLDYFCSELGSSAMRVLLPYYEGLTKKVVAESRASLLINHIKKLLVPAANEWMSMENFRLRYMVGDTLIDDNSAYTSLFSPRTFDSYMVTRSDVPVPQQSCDLPRPPYDLWTSFTWPFVISYLRLLVAVGVIEMADPPVDDRVLTASEWLAQSRVRLTPLGRYAFGLTKVYKPTIRFDMGADIEVDSRNMIITVLNPDSPVKIYIEQTGQSIGHYRYAFSAKKMAISAGSRDECLKRIDKMREILKPEKGSSWDVLLKECELRAHSSLPGNEQYALVKLNPETPGLIDFINSNPEVRSHVVRAEGGMILVTDTYYDTLAKLLAREGYPIT